MVSNHPRPENKIQNSKVEMSRSYRKPFSAVTGRSSAKEDKILAHRGMRRAQNRALRTCLDWDEFLVPHKFECAWNDVWSWRRDGKQTLQEFHHNDFNPFYLVDKYTS